MEEPFLVDTSYSRFFRKCSLSDPKAKIDPLQEFPNSAEFQRRFLSGSNRQGSLRQKAGRSAAFARGATIGGEKI